MSATSDRIRREFKEGDDKRDAGLVTPDDIVRYDNIEYGTDAKWQILDVYRPKDKDGEALPVIVSVHGGGWVYGDKERYQYYCMSLAQRGFAVVNFTYRLAPEFQYPAPLEDTNLVFRWVLEHEKVYGFDAKHIFGVGDSAGGNILGLYCAICTNKEYAEQYNFTVPEGFSPNAVALNCGVYYLDMKRDDDVSKLMEDYLPEKGSKTELELMNLNSHVTKDYPPTYIMTAQGDFLKSHAPLLAQKLADCEVPFLYRLYGDSKDKLCHVFHCDMKSKAASLCNDEECDFFRRFC